MAIGLTELELEHLLVECRITCLLGETHPAQSPRDLVFPEMPRIDLGAFVRGHYQHHEAGLRSLRRAESVGQLEPRGQRRIAGRFDLDQCLGSRRLHVDGAAGRPTGGELYEEVPATFVLN